MRKILLDVSPTGVQHYAHVSDDELITEEFTPTAVENLILDGNAELRNHGIVNKKSMFRHAARIPINTYYGWKKKYRTEGYAKTMTWGEFEIMMLNSRDHGKLLTGVKSL